MPNTVNNSKPKRHISRANEEGGRKSQLDKIIDAKNAVQFDPKPSSDELLFLSSILVQAFLPHSDPKELTWQRKNGKFTLTVKSGLSHENGKTKIHGIPYGSIPRLILAWLNTEAIRNNSDPENEYPRRIYVGKSFSQFADKLGIDKSGGKKGGLTRVKNQAERLFRSELTVHMAGNVGYMEKDIKVADGRFIFWDSASADQPSLFESYIELSEPLFNLFIRNPFPLDWRIMSALKQSPMALDIYTWLTQRVSHLGRKTTIRWETLQEQFGSDFGRLRDFRTTFRKHAKKIQALWPALKIDTSHSEYLILRPSPTLITQTKMKNYTLA